MHAILVLSRAVLRIPPPAFLQELASSLFTATIVARDRPVDDTASVEGAAPSTIAARSASSEESCSDSQSIGPFSDSNHSPPRARRTPPLQTTISNNSQSSDSFEIRSHTSAQTRVQTTATANEATTEGRMTVQLDLDYTLVLQAVQAKHQRHMSQLMEEHAQQVAARPSTQTLAHGAGDQVQCKSAS